jgi:perosamine synthetase
MPETLGPGSRPGPGVVPLSVPEIHGNEWKYVKECLDTGWVSSVGPFVDRFEREFAAKVGARHAVAVVNGTAALHVSLLLADVRPGDEVLVSTMTFVAPANAVRYVGAHVVPIDAEPESWQMDPRQVEAFLREKCSRIGGDLRNRSTGRRVKAIIPVHILGHPVELAPLLSLAEEFGLAVVEDASESLGSLYRGRHVGTHGLVGCYSFNGNKLLTTGGGGMLVTDDAVIANRARYLTTQAKDDPLEYVHGEIGFNYRLTNVLAAIGVAQLEQLGEALAAKTRIADTYARHLGEIPGVALHPAAPWASAVPWLYTVLIEEARFGMSSRALMKALGEARIQARPLWRPVHLQPAFRDGTTLPVAEQLYRDALSLPSSVGMTEPDQLRVIETVAGATRGNGR